MYAGQHFARQPLSTYPFCEQHLFLLEFYGMLQPVARRVYIYEPRWRARDTQVEKEQCES